MIHGKTFSRMSKFSKGEENWKDRSFDFGVTLDSACSDMKETLRVIETVQEDMDVEKVTALDTERAANMNLNKLSKELYEVLVMLTEGEAKIMVRNVRNNDGMVAWHQMYKHYNKRTLGRVLRAHREVMHPRKTTDLNNLISAIMEWEDKWAKMEKDYSKEIKLPPMCKMAALMDVCPEEVQDVIYQNMDEVHEDYERARQTYSLGSRAE